MNREVELEFNKKLENYLKNNGVNDIPTNNKEKLKLLKAIVFNGKVDIDVADLKQAKNRANGVKDKDNTYFDTIQNLELNVSDGLYYIANIKGIVKEERKLKRRTKIKSFFKI